MRPKCYQAFSPRDFSPWRIRISSKDRFTHSRRDCATLVGARCDFFGSQSPHLLLGISKIRYIVRFFTARLLMNSILRGIASPRSNASFIFIIPSVATGRIVSPNIELPLIYGFQPPAMTSPIFDPSSRWRVSQSSGSPTGDTTSDWALNSAIFVGRY